MADSTKHITYGKPIITWETDEYARHDRTWFWYLLAGVIGLALLIYAVLTASFPFAVVILMIGIISLLGHLREPRVIRIYITTNGVVVGSHFYSYKEIKDFSIIYEPPDVKIIYLDFVSVLHPIISIPLEDEDPNMVRNAILPYALENIIRDSESLTDMIARLYKL